MKLYFAAPLFTTPEREWNAEVTAALRAAGHEVFLPQEQVPGKDSPGVFATDVGGIDWADGLLAIMDGPDPDSGTAWEVGYAFRKKPIVLVRTDFRATTGYAGGYKRDAHPIGDHPPRRACRVDHGSRGRGPAGARADPGRLALRRRSVS